MASLPRILCIIPARGGSRGIPHKNRVSFAGKPLIAWSIDQAKHATLVSDTVVSSDDQQILQIAKDFGAETVLRPHELSLGTAPSEAALIHALDYMEQQKSASYDLIVFLQATSPIRQRDDIDNAISKLIAENADSLLSVRVLNDYFIWEDGQEGVRSVNYDYKHRKMRQDISTTYLENGSIYVFRPEILRRHRNRLGGKIVVYEMDRLSSQQIDNQDDLELCELIAKKVLM